jgi:hypothetical protein
MADRIISMTFFFLPHLCSVSCAFDDCFNGQHSEKGQHPTNKGQSREEVKSTIVGQ